MAKIVKQPHGGYIKLQEKGDKSSNPKGRPKIPKTIKDFIKTLENEDDSINISFQAIELILINEEDKKKVDELFTEIKKLCKGLTLKGSKGNKMAMNAYSRAMKGDIRFLDWLTKMGYAGGYEPIKTQNDNKNTDITPPKGKIKI